MPILPTKVMDSVMMKQIILIATMMEATVALKRSMIVIVLTVGVMPLVVDIYLS